MTPSVPTDIRRRRAKELEIIARANHESFAKSFIGKEIEVCIERDGSGYSGEYLHCILDAAAPRRSLAKVMVTDYFPKTLSLFATIRA
jgi:tRNA A37 methylthiotransferase MiaB